MKVVAVAIVALVVGFLVGVLLSDFINPTFHIDAPYGAHRANQKN